jgi:hypothetical protein
MPFGKLSKRLAQKLDAKIERLSEQIQSVGSQSNHSYTASSYPDPPPLTRPQSLSPHVYPLQSYPRPTYPSPSPTTPRPGSLNLCLPQPHHSRPHVVQLPPLQPHVQPQPHTSQFHPSQAHISSPRSSEIKSPLKSTAEQDPVDRVARAIDKRAILPAAQLAETPKEAKIASANRGLCEVCARHDWEYHLNRYYDSRLREDEERYHQHQREHAPQPPDWEPVRIKHLPYPGKFVLELHKTSFDLQPYSAKNQDSCSFCRLVVWAVEFHQWPKDLEWKKT